MMPKQIIAHRGASAYVKGNTMESFMLAITQGADMIEFDVRKTKDNVMISYHDNCIDGICIRQLEYEDISRRAIRKGFEIPTLDRILDSLRGKIKLDVELKETGYEKTVLESIKQYFKEDEFIMTSFNDRSLQTVKDFYPNVKTGLILGKKKPRKFVKTRISEIFPLKRFNQSRADYLVIHWKLKRFGILNRISKHNIPALVWTVNEMKGIIECLKDDRISGIITDKPDLASTIRDTLIFHHNAD